MGRKMFFAFGIGSYFIFFITSLYSIGFVGNLIVPKSIDSGTPTPFGQALEVDGLLLALFAIQHSIMARKGFKCWWKRYVPDPIERSTYILLSSLMMILLFRQWKPLTITVWNIENPSGWFILTALFWVGWALVVTSSFLVNHFDLFGLRQVYTYMKGREYSPIRFKKPAIYKLVRHPIMLGYIIAFWSAPRMTAGHFVFSLAMTAYILIGIQFEERDLRNTYGPAYQEYQQQVSMLMPIPKQ